MHPHIHWSLYHSKCKNYGKPVHSIDNMDEENVTPYLKYYSAIKRKKPFLQHEWALRT